jgi:dTDP-4-dehydrorhamnose reductase
MSESTTRWLVTGSAGQLARSLVAVAGDCGIQAEAPEEAALDVTDEASIRSAIDEIRPDVVLNAAAFTQVDLCETREEEAERVNALAPGLLARACRGRALLVHISTEYVFAGDAARPIPEHAATLPLSAYGRGKLAGERAVAESGCEHLIVRTQWLFGPGHCFPRTILKRAAEHRELRVVEDQVGRPTWTGALAPALIDAAKRDLRGVLHLACDGVASWYDFAREIVAEGTRRGFFGPVDVLPIPTEEMPRPAARPPYAVLGVGRARAAGIRLPHWREALTAYLDAEAEGRDA